LSRSTRSAKSGKTLEEPVSPGFMDKLPGSSRSSRVYFWTGIVTDLQGCDDRKAMNNEREEEGKGRTGNVKRGKKT